MKTRSLLFCVVFFLWTTFITVPFSFLLVFPRRILVWHLYVWAKGTMFLLRHIASISYQVEGREYIPDVPAVFLANHQSMWETIIFHILAHRHDPCYIMKRQLFFIPFYGFHAWKFGMIGIKRGKKDGPYSMKKILRLCPKRLTRGQSTILFPEGTRVPMGETREYGVGAYALYRSATSSACPVPVVRVALNAGRCWQKGLFGKKSGVITIRFLPPLEVGLDRSSFDQAMVELRRVAADLSG